MNSKNMKTYLSPVPSRSLESPAVAHSTYSGLWRGKQRKRRITGHGFTLLNKTSSAGLSFRYREKVEYNSGTYLSEFWVTVMVT
jgi:hypothetical protein